MANTVIGSSLVIEGEISSKNLWLYRGTAKGRIETTQPLFVENSAQLEADIEAETVEISGNLTGNVTAQNTGRDQG